MNEVSTYTLSKENFLTNRFQVLKDYLNQDFETRIREWFPNGHRFGRDWRTGDFNDTPPSKGSIGSLCFNLRDKYAHDFSRPDENGGDIIAIYARRYCGGDQGRAFNELADKYAPHLSELKFGNHENSGHDSHGGNGCEVGGSKGSGNNSGGGSYNNNNTDGSSNNNNANNTPAKTKYVPSDKEIYAKINDILKKSKDYQPNDPVGLYLKSRGIVKHSSDVRVTEDKMGNNEHIPVMLSICKSKDNKTVGVSEVFLTLDGKKYSDNVTTANAKIQRKYPNQTISGNPVRLSPKGENNGWIYCTEGVENGLSIQEHLNNEVWCALSIVNIPNLPFEDDRVYVIVFDNDNKNGVVSDGYKQAVDKILRLKNKHIFYCMPEEDGKDANDLHKEGKLGDFLNNAPFIPIACKRYRYDPKTKADVEIPRPLTPMLFRQEISSLDRRFVSMLNFGHESVAMRFLEHYGKNYRVVNNADKKLFYHYAEGIYKRDYETEIDKDISRTIYALYNEYDYLTDKQRLKDFGNAWQMNGENFEIKAKVKKAVKSCSVINILPDDFDSDEQNFLNFANGCYDVDEDKLCPHSPDKLFLKKIKTPLELDINPEFKYSEWNKMLDVVFDRDKERIKYFQKCVGYTFSGNAKHKKIFFLKGETDTGKTTLMDSLIKAMKEYCVTLKHHVLTSQDEASNNTMASLANLKGSRLCNISELPQRKKIQDDLLKSCTQDTFTAARKFEDPITFKNLAKFWIDTNHLNFDSFDEAVKNRLIIFEFKNRFYDAGTEGAIKTGRVKDPDLSAKLASDESRKFIRPVSKIIFTQKTNYTKKTSSFIFLIRRRI
jgi:P4 family phage/plasmid primase-like protien